MKKIVFSITFIMLLLICNGCDKKEDLIVLQYAHMNTPDSEAGIQAKLLSEMVSKRSKGKIKIDIYPTSKLGSLHEMIDLVSSGRIAIHHTTMSGIGDLNGDFQFFDTPYLFDNVDELMQAASVNSPIMEKLNRDLIQKSGVRVFYTFYFGTRQLTANIPVRRYSDLKNIKIRSIPFPMYSAAVEGLGAEPVPIDILNLYDSLRMGIVAGQENPVSTIYSMKFYEVQKYLIKTGHIMGAEIVVFNESIWRELSDEQRNILEESAAEISKAATLLSIERENASLGELRNMNMIIIDESSGLDVKSFKENCRKVIIEKFGKRFDDFYKMINDRW